jgi:hypothetical protein
MIISNTRTSVSLMEALISAEEKMVSEVEIIISATDTVFLKADNAFAVSDRHLMKKAESFRSAPLSVNARGKSHSSAICR